MSSRRSARPGRPAAGSSPPGRSRRRPPTGGISLTQPISRRYRLDEADEACRALDRGEITGRAIVVMA